jgi:hypothetical protein
MLVGVEPAGDVVDVAGVDVVGCTGFVDVEETTDRPPLQPATASATNTVADPMTPARVVQALAPLTIVEPAPRGVPDAVRPCPVPRRWLAPLF